MANGSRTIQKLGRHALALVRQARSLAKTTNGSAKSAASAERCRALSDLLEDTEDTLAQLMLELRGRAETAPPPSPAARTRAVARRA